MKKTNIFYWIFTGLFAAMMLASAIPDVLSSPIAVKGMHEELGYPVYFIPFIGVAKVLGGLAILLPISARIKEWAYAGLFFDLIGATFSIIAIGKPDWMFMILPLFLAVGSYTFYLKRKRLQKKKEVNFSNASVLAA
jgi:uncharacterized membrane protein YphA (DoxX/SURF4 family)